MLYVFCGSNLVGSKEKARKLISSLRNKRKDATYEEITGDNWNASILESHLGGQGLFSSKYIIFLNQVAAHEENIDEFKSFFESMNESENIFIVLEGRINQDIKKDFVKYAEKVVESETQEKDGRFSKKEFNIFSLADAIGSRDHVKAWSIYREAVERGIESESILGTIFWQIKSIILATSAKSANEAGLNPFVFGKAKRYSSNFSTLEIGNLLHKTVSIYHDGHRGLLDTELAIEKMLLGI